ncbi:MAG: saccharopine dehydrogenase family protein, partial [Polyangiales bacterium]
MSVGGPSRPYEIVVFGATGFTGQLVAQYLAENAPRDLRWAIAGRNRGKLEEVRRTINRPELPILSASSDDEDSLLAMARSTRVVLTTVGPYAEHGEPVVRNAIDGGADYVDITGEPAFVDLTLSRYDERAQKAGVRIVSCCGFDSIPHDLGAYFAVRALAQLATNEPIKVEGLVRSRGTF